MTPDDTARLVITSDYALNADFTEYRKVGTTRISNRRFPPGTVYQTPEGLRAEDEDTRCAVDVQGGVYPIRESVFRATYEAAAIAAARPAPDATLWEAALDAATLLEDSLGRQTEPGYADMANVARALRAALATPEPADRQAGEGS